VQYNVRIYIYTYVHKNVEGSINWNPAVSQSVSLSIERRLTASMANVRVESDFYGVYIFQIFLQCCAKGSSFNEMMCNFILTPDELVSLRTESRGWVVRTSGFDFQSCVTGSTDMTFFLNSSFNQPLEVNSGIVTLNRWRALPLVSFQILFDAAWRSPLNKRR
jgi:hypothetical protein